MTASDTPGIPAMTANGSFTLPDPIGTARRGSDQAGSGRGEALRREIGKPAERSTAGIRLRPALPEVPPRGTTGEPFTERMTPPGAPRRHCALNNAVYIPTVSKTQRFEGDYPQHWGVSHAYAPPSPIGTDLSRPLVAGTGGLVKWDTTSR
ncbi:hypothetical protein GCM10018952_01460 [Streptosporangium vulgare]